MASILYNSRTGDPKWKPGMVTQSDYQSKNCLYRRVNQTPTAISPASFGSGNFQLTTTDGRYNYVGLITAGSGSSILSQVASQVGYPFQVSLNAGGNIEILTSTNVAWQLYINGIFTANIGAVVPSILEAGRLAVPDYANPLPNNNGQVFDTYRYPQLGDNGNLIAQAVFVVRDNRTDFPQDPTGLAQSTLGRVSVGNCFAGLFRGVMATSTLFGNSATGQLYVETTAAGTANQGRITTSPSGSTIPIPVGKIQLVDTSALANQILRARIQY